eukprot:9377608-Pyramimonas_sp.AAC.1
MEEDAEPFEAPRQPCQRGLQQYPAAQEPPSDRGAPGARHSTEGRGRRRRRRLRQQRRDR